MNDILISIIENKINESKVEYRKDMKGVIENLYRVTLNEKDKYGFHKNNSLYFFTCANNNRNI